MTQVKICGLTSQEAVDAAIGSGADFLGFVVFEKSPRHVDVATARDLVAGVEGQARTVVLLVDPDDALVENIVAKVDPDILQLHGFEPPQRVEEIKRLSGCEVWKAISVASTRDIAAVAPYLASSPGGESKGGGENNGADLILYDAKPPADPSALPGGNGLAFDWRLLQAGGVQRPFVLAGGLTPDNVTDAVRLIDPFVVDVSTGVERAPGEKDPALIQRFIHAAKTAKQTV